MKLYSPDGRMEMNVHPSKVESMLKKGWTEEKQKKSKAKVEKTVAEEVVEHVEAAEAQDKESQ